MIIQIKKISFALCLILPVLIFLDIVPAQAATVLPQGLVMEETYRPGRGRPVGIVEQVLGDVVIMHGDILKGYWAKRGIHLYKGDTVMTPGYGRVRFKLNDGSTLSLASGTKLKLTRSVYDQEKKRRSSFLPAAVALGEWTLQFRHTRHGSQSDLGRLFRLLGQGQTGQCVSALRSWSPDRVSGRV